ncbi:MAG: GNAT family N-acetyltransferase [Thermoguttaceae bacterium]|jgi:putative acetyltransferase
MITIQIEKPNNKPVAELIEKLDEYLLSLYPPECNHLLDIETLLKPDIMFLTAIEGHKYVGCGAIRIVRGQYAEIKRMFVLPGERGKGIGYKILTELQNIALRLKLNVLRLETGVRQSEALKLYEKFGFYKISAFGQYKPSGMCLFYEKRIG